MYLSPQISTNFSGWYELGEAPTQVDTSKSMTTTPPLESSELTVKDHLSSSTASCTRCVTIALARSTQRPVSIFVIMNSFLQSSGPQNLDHMELWFFKANFKSVEHNVCNTPVTHQVQQSIHSTSSIFLKIPVNMICKTFIEMLIL